MTSPTKSLGRAYVELHGDYSKLGPEAEKEIQRELDKAASKVDFDTLADEAEKAGKQAGARFTGGFYRDVAGRLHKEGAGFAKEAELAGQTFLGVFGKTLKNDRNDDVGSGFSGMIAKALGGLKGGFSAIGDFGSKIGSTFSQLSSAGGIVGNILLFAGLAVLGPILLGVAGSLLQLSAALLALPAAAGVAIAVIAPLVIAFQGFGEAVGAGLSGDTEKFNEALKKLAPSARAVVKEFVAFKPVFDAIKRSVQQAFFAPLIGEIRSFLGRTLPLFKTGLTQISFALGNVSRELLRTFSSPTALAAFSAILTTALHVVQRLEPSLTRLFDGLLATIGPAMPFVERFIFFLLDGLGSLGDWLGKISGDGRLVGWLEKAEVVGRALWDVFVQFGRFVTTLLAGFGDTGTKFLEDFADGLGELITWLQSDEGAQFIDDVATAIAAAGEAFGFLLSLLPYVFRFWSMLISVWRETDDVLAAIGAWFADIGSDIWDFLKGAGSAIADFFTETIPGAFNDLIEWFKALPGRVVDAIIGLKDALVTFIVGAIDAMIESFFVNIGRMLGLLIALPQLFIRGLEKFPELMRELWNTAWSYAVNATMEWWAKIQAFWESIPGRLTAARDAIVGFVSNLWTTVRDNTVKFVSEGIDKAMNLLNSLPGKLAALGPALLTAARNLGRKIGDGLAEIGNFASDIGKRIVNTVKSGVNSVIASINRGIGDIDAALPVSLPRIPYLAKGAIINGPTLAVVGEAGPEVVLPLSNARRTQELAEQSGLLDILKTPGDAAPVVNVTAILDGIGLLTVMKTIVNQELTAQGQELAYGARV